jgi:hypothetical protein
MPLTGTLGLPKKSNGFGNGRRAATSRRKPPRRFSLGIVRLPKRRSGGRKRRLSNVHTYRLYCLDGVGKVASAEWIEAADDETAIMIANRLRDGRPCELWQGSRAVARMERDPLR